MKTETKSPEETERIILGDINKNPTLQSLLYDCNLLPEQLDRESKEWKYMVLIVAAFRLGQLNQR